MRIAILLLLATYTGFEGYSQLPSVNSGRIDRYEQFPSRYVTPRNVDVWLPEGYDSSKRYAVLYMQDGQMLYDSAQTWNHQSWDVEEAATRLMQAKDIRDFIIVGIWNGGVTRHGDYFPQKPFLMLTPVEQDSLYHSRRPEGVSVFKEVSIRSDGYLKFIVKELKPFIDRTYNTAQNRSSTFIAGSSMGGMISWYAVCEYPGVFGGAACLSTHWPGIFTVRNNPYPDAVLNYLEKHLPNPATHRFYFDYGTMTLDSLYGPIQVSVDAVMQKRGYTDKNWMTRSFPGADHSENAWRERMEVPLLFLLGK